MRRIGRLLHYIRPYTVHVVISVLLMLVVGVLATFRILLIKPIIDNALSPAESPARIPLFPDSEHASHGRSAIFRSTALS